MSMRSILILLAFLATVAFAHMGEEETGPEQHSPLDILLDSPQAIITAFVIYALVAYVFYTLFPLKKDVRPKFFLMAGLIALVFIVLIYLSLTREPAPPKPYHTHADFLVVLNGVPYNFSQAKYMSTAENRLSLLVHLHDMDGGVIHHHSRNVTMAAFFKSINMTFNSTCLVTDTGESYCDGDNRSLRMFVMHYGGRWMQNQDMEKYVFQDMDRILITYGNPAVPPTSEFPLVSDRACIQSEKCPERGMPSNESSCAGDVCTV